MDALVFNFRLSLIVTLAALCGCVYQPLYGDGLPGQGSYGVALSQVWVEEAESRVGQQVRNHLIFLLQGGRDDPQTRYLAKLRVLDINRRFAAVEGVRDQTAGSVTVTVSYDLIDREGNIIVAEGHRVARATFDRTGQSFANSRALRDAENRAAHEAAEELRLAFAADLSIL